MSALREIALAKLRAAGAKPGQQAGQSAGQQVSHAPVFATPAWDSQNGGNLPQTGRCPAVPLPKGRDSGTGGQKPGQQAGQSAGQSGGIDSRIAAARCREWRAHLARLDPCRPPEGWPMTRWQQLYDDAIWLMNGFGEKAARDGYSSADVFGLWPDKPHWGGIADRLRGSRSLILTADRAHWRSWGEVQRYNRGSYHDLRPFWEAGAQG